MRNIKINVVASLFLTLVVAGCFNSPGSSSDASSSLDNGTPPIKACSFNNQSVASGGSVTAFQNSAVPFGQLCVSETRTCNDGSLSGSYANAACMVAPAAACTFNGSLVNNGSSVNAYQNASVAFGQSCVSESRTCNNGTLSGSYTNASCTVQPAASCTLNGQTIANGASVTEWQNASVPAGSTCVSESRTCSNGTLSGSYTNAACMVQVANGSCTLNGQTVTSGGNITAFQASTVAYPGTCAIEARSCSNGVLSGSYTFPSCTVTGGHFTINFTFGTSVTSSPNSAAIQAAFAKVKQLLESRILSAITISVTVGFGEVNGQTVSALGQSMYYEQAPFTAAQIATYLRGSSQTATDQTAYAHLPAAPAAGPDGWWMSMANAKALGIDSGVYTDGWVGFGSGYSWTFDDTNGVAPGTFDFIGCALHEVTEVLGRFSGAPYTGNGTPLDMFRYSAPGVSGYAGAAYFSIDGGVTNLAGFNTNPGGDSGDLDGSLGNDCANAFTGGGLTVCGPEVWQMLDVIGYHVTP